MVDRAIRFAEIARRAGKKVVLGEAWLYKTRDHELRGQAVAAARNMMADPPQPTHTGLAFQRLTTR